MQTKFLLSLLMVMPLAAQQSQSSETVLLQAILNRMDALEKQNRQMVQEIEDLKLQIKAAHEGGAVEAATAPLDERIAVTENRVEEQAQTKVESSQKLPVTLTGQLLFNAFANTGHLGLLQDTTYSPFLSTTNSSGATVRQTMIGLDFRGPSLPGNGKVNGHLMMDFYSGIPSEQLDWLRVRTSDISFDWQRRSLAFAYDKALVSPRQPNSLAEVSIPPLADAGNLWLWLPQLRYEERIRLGNSAGLKAQAALLQTDETYNYVPSELTGKLEKSRPAGEGRVMFWKSWQEQKRLEVGFGFHASTSHAGPTSVASRLYSVDWLATPFSKLEISGTYFCGQNFGGLGALSPGFVVNDNGLAAPVRGEGGWNQFSFPLTSRLTLNLFAGLQANRLRDLQFGQAGENLTYAGNVMIHVSQNVVFSFESLQMRTRVKQSEDLIRNRYDLALGYRF